ncbi:discoidin domain-containing protein [Paenibacillus sp. N1-5-1-14]|uniref:discoidin domain-containing protein n=1 Tax=Paenibacillus radicibacter TaxID=2972488 RepID=UPI0021593DF4|nr:discoidin domain-containing protein [Paenibacillus radicibacter]MCR8643419.1 discoidin domain-containing protein [Paenibacillus radicibacter]
MKNWINKQAMNRLLLAFVATTVCSLTALGLPTLAQAADSTLKMSFMAISDAHAPNDARIKSALNDAVLNNVNAVFLVGDLTDFADNASYQSLMNSMNAVTHPPAYYGMGNHDVRWTNESYATVRSRFLTYTGMQNHYYDTWINGYHFIMLGTDTIQKDQADYSAAELLWLKTKLAENADPNKPIFIFSHEPLSNTVPDSFLARYQPGYKKVNPNDEDPDGIIQDVELKNILSGYPQSVFVTGHTHYSVTTPGNYLKTAFGHMINDSSLKDDGYHPNAEGLIFNVYDDRVEINGRDFKNKSTIASWTIGGNVDTQIIPQSQMSATATSQESGDEAANVLDGNTATIWHTKWNLSNPLPQSITLNLGGNYNVNQLKMKPRQDGGTNGIITGYKVYTSTNGTTFSQVATGTWTNDASEKSVTFPTTAATHIRLEAMG